MDIGTTLAVENLDGLEKSCVALQRLGFRSCQLGSWSSDLWTDKTAVQLSFYLQKYGLTPSSFWCGYEGPRSWDFYQGPVSLGLLPRQYREVRVKNLCDGADFARKLGITDVITHMGFIPEDPNNPEFLPFCDAVRTVALHLKENGQYLLFETGQETPVALLRCIETVGTDNLGVNLDTANLILYGKANPVDALDVIGRYVRGVHAKDGFYPVNGHDLGAETKIGRGKVDFRAFFTKLHALGYNSWVTIEREVPDEEEWAADVAEAKEYLENLVHEIDEEAAKC